MRLRALVCLLCCAATATATAGTAQAATAELPALHAVKGSGARIADSGGRQVILRGVDVDALGQYYQQYPQWPATMPLSANDYKEMAGLGFNVQRLVISWSELEPTEGAFNEAYVARIRQAVQWAAQNGIYTVLDMHQDAYGIAVASTASTRCPLGFYPNVGYDGAPAWATFTNGQSTCALAGLGERSAAEATAWQNFYENSGGIEQQLADTWGKLAAVFAADPDVAGYDLLNEPDPGSDYNQLTGMGSYYALALAAIRSAEGSVAGGFSHIAFFEPGAQWSEQSGGTLPEGSFDEDPNVVFAPHLYASSIGAGTIDQGFANAAQAAAGFSTTVWAGEYGWYAHPVSDDTADIANFAADQDKYLYGGAWWMWKQACGSPNTVNYFGESVPAQTDSLVEVPCTQAALSDASLPSVSAMTIPAVLVQYIGRATVHAAPGQIRSLVSDAATGSFSVAGSTAAAPASDCQLTVWIPGSGRPRFSAVGVHGLVAVRVRGGYDVSGCASGSYSLTLTGRAAPGLSCAAALKLKADGADRFEIVESARAESPCLAVATLSARGVRSARFRVTVPIGGAQVISVVKRLRPAFGAGRLELRGSVTDADGDSYPAKYAL